MDELMDQQIGPLSHHQTALSRERESLVRFCHHLISDASVAEDLAQETLIRAWQRADQLRDPTSRSGWLKAIARNVCRQWLRDHRTVALTMPDDETDGWAGLGRSEPADAFDLEVELDRQDLAALLDRAMALLPVETRQILVERFVRETPLAETARHLGLSEGAVTMRIQRGKLALRRVLVTAYPQGLASHGIDVGEGSEKWRLTRIWCPWCGTQRLEGVLVRDLGLFRLRCPTCGPLNNSLDSHLFQNALGHRGALLRLLEWSDQLYKHSFDHQTTPCPGCGRGLSLRKDTSGSRPLISYYCARCQCGTWNGQRINVLGLPEVRRFWEDHPRMRVLPEREAEVGGRPAVVVSFASVRSRDRVDIVYARDDLRLLRVQDSRAVES